MPNAGSTPSGLPSGASTPITSGAGYQNITNPYTNPNAITSNPAPVVPPTSSQMADYNSMFYNTKAPLGFSKAEPAPVIPAKPVVPVPSNNNSSPTVKTFTPASTENNATQSPAPDGWDQETYNNFKAANPTLEPTPEDTARMQAAGSNQFSPITPAATKPATAAIDYNAVIGKYITGGYDNVNDIATATGLKPEDINKFVQGDSNLSYQMNMNNLINKNNTALTDARTKLDNISNGVFTLSDSENAMVQATKDMYSQMEAVQQTANANYEGSVQNAEIRSGRQEFMNQVSSGISKGAVDAGLAKIRDIETTAIGKVNDLTKAFQDKRYTAAKDIYDGLQKDLAAKTTAIQDLHKAAGDALKDTQAAQAAADAHITSVNNNEKIRQDVMKTTATNAADFVMSQLTGDQTKDMQIVQSAAQQLGIDPGVLMTALTDRQNALQTTQLAQSTSAFNLSKPYIVRQTTDDMGNKVDVYGVYDPTSPNGYREVDNPNVDSGSGDGGSTSTGTGAISIPAGTLAAKNNNPGNLRFVGQANASQGEGGFAKFATPEAGYAALKAQIDLDKSRDLTCSQFVNKYAPSSENDTSTYIKQFCNQLGVNPNDKMSSLSTDDIASFMAKKESGTTINAGTTQSKSVQAPGTMGTSKIDSSTPGYFTDQVPKTGGLTQALLDKWGLEMAVTGQAPTGIGLASSGAGGLKKNAITNRAAEIAGDSNFATNKAKYGSLSKALNTQTDFYTNIDRALTAAENVRTLTQDLFKNYNINTNSSTWANKTLNDLAKQAGDSGDIRAYQAAMYEIGNDYAQVFARGGQRSQQGNQDAQDLVSGDVKLSDISKVLSTLQAIGKQQIGASQYEIDNINKQIDNLTAGKDSVSPPSQSIADQVKAKGYDYDKMIKDGHSDAEIRSALGL